MRPAHHAGFNSLARAVWRRPVRALLVALSLLSAALVSAQSMPPLPELPLDTYEAGIREPITQAYRSVESQPRDPDRNGTLGMLLYANEQYDLEIGRAHV